MFTKKFLKLCEVKENLTESLEYLIKHYPEFAHEASQMLLFMNKNIRKRNGKWY